MAQRQAMVKRGSTQAIFGRVALPEQKPSRIALTEGNLQAQYQLGEKA